MKQHGNQVSKRISKMRKIVKHALLIFPFMLNNELLSELAHSENFALRKIPQFHLISWCGNFVEGHSFHIVSGGSPEITVFFTVSINGLKSRSALTLISLISVFSKPCAYVARVDVPWCCTRN